MIVSSLDGLVSGWWALMALLAVPYEINPSVPERREQSPEESAALHFGTPQ